MLLWACTIFCFIGVINAFPACDIRLVANRYELFASKVDDQTFCGDGSYEKCNSAQTLTRVKMSMGALRIIQAGLMTGGLIGNNPFILYTATFMEFFAGGWLEMAYGTFIVSEKKNICLGALYEATIKNSFTEMCRHSNPLDYNARQDCTDECENYFQVLGIVWLALSWPVSLYMCLLLWSHAQELTSQQTMKYTAF